MLTPMTAEKNQLGIAAGRAARAARKAMLEQLKAGTFDLDTVWLLVDTGERQHRYVGRTRVQPLVRALPGIGNATAEQLLTSAGIDPTRRLDRLGSRQRAAIDDAARTAAERTTKHVNA